MPASERRLDDLAGAVLDGAPIDWAEAESSAGADARLVKHLKLVASVARVHRDALPGASLTSSGPVSEPSVPPERWGHLRLLELVGRGAFGEVFRAWDTRLDREVALKILAAPAWGRPQRGTIIQEGRLLARVRHPNVVTIHGAEQIGDQVGLWMEFVRGQSLEQLLRQGTVFTSAEVARIGLDLAGAVSAVHAAGLLHRDIKAHNVTRAEDGRVVLMDFGTGKELDDNSSTDLAGTPLYLAPEVLGGRAASVQSDIYSLGVLLYHLLTGSYPVRGGTIRDVRLAHERHDRVALRVSRPDVRPGLARVIERAIDPEPGRRYANAAALSQDLASLQRRPVITRIWYGLAGVAAVALVAAAVVEVRARMTGDQRSLTARLGSLVARSTSPIDTPIIVVRPFRNLAEAERERLVDNVTAELISQLVVVEGLKVRSQTSSFMLKNTPLDLESIGSRLGVNLVVEGEARMTGDVLRLSASLVSVADDVSLWSDSFSRPIKSEADVVGVAEEVTRKIAGRLQLKPGRVQKRYPTLDLAASDLFWKARAIRDGRGPAARAAIPMFEEVIRRDRSYAPAYAALAATYGGLAIPYPIFGGGAISPSEAAAEMRPLLDKAFEFDANLAEAHAVQGYLHTFELRWVDAEASFRRAIDLDPSQTSVYTDFVLSTLGPWGRLDDAMTVLQTALQADPLSLDVRRVMAQTQLSAGRFDDALANCGHILQINPSFPFADAWCDRALIQKGQIAEALTSLQKNAERNEGWIGYVYAISGRRAEAEAIAARNADLPQRQALVFAGLGDKDRAFDALERLAAVNAPRAGAYLTYPELAGLRGDPRFTKLRDKLGFPR